MSSKTNQQPLVSVAMNCYNGGAYIAEAIESVLRQQVKFPYELVIGDDGSTDNSMEVAEQYAAKYPDIIHITRTEVNLGIPGNTIRTWAECRGKYIAICDCDDVWVEPGKLQMQVDFLEKHPDYGMAYTDADVISEQGGFLDDPEIEHHRTRFADGEIFFQLLQGNFVVNSTTVFRRSYLDRHVIDPNRNYFIQDYILWLHIASQDKVHYIPGRMTWYRRHSTSITHKAPKIRVQTNRMMYHKYLHQHLANFDRSNRRTLPQEERMIMFRKLLSLAFRSPGSVTERLRALAMLPKYMPAMGNVLKVAVLKARKLLPA
jgi:glycosyltransferase involved in cell wall biosynthesis